MNRGDLMGKYGAKDVFNRLAEAYLIASNRNQAAQRYVNDLKREHDYELNDYYYNKDKKEHSKKALKNDVKGVAKR
jgi:hypothetical protein